MRIRDLFWAIGLIGLASAPVEAASMTYTNSRYLYSVDYPASWHMKEVGKVTTFLSPFESKEDKFAENVTIVVEDISAAPAAMTLLDYHRQAVSEAPKRLSEFKMLEEARTEFQGREAIAILYTAQVKGQTFKFKDYKFLVGRDMIVMTYTALKNDFDVYLSAAEKVMHSLRVSP